METNLKELYSSFMKAFKAWKSDISNAEQQERGNAIWISLKEQHLPNTENFVQAVRGKILEFKAETSKKQSKLFSPSPALL